MSRERKVGTAAATKRRLGQKHTKTFPRKKGQWEIPLKWTGLISKKATLAIETRAELTFMGKGWLN